MATINNLYIDQGTDYSTIVTVSTANGDPFNLTGFDVAAQMRKSYQSTKFHSFTATVIDALAGKIRLTLTAAESEAIKAGRWLYDVQIMREVTGPKKRVVEGIVVINPQITKT